MGKNGTIGRVRIGVEAIKGKEAKRKRDPDEKKKIYLRKSEIVENSVEYHGNESKSFSWLYECL